MSKTTANTPSDEPNFSIQRIYVKDVSFEAPQAPDIFQQEWKPDLNMQLHTNSSLLVENVYEVTLKVNVTATTKGKIAFLAEVAQSGIFEMKFFSAEQIKDILGSVCPSILFPYAREMISNLVSRGTFPPLYLSPINFDALYAEHQNKHHKSGADIEHSVKGSMDDSSFNSDDSSGSIQ